MIATEVDRLKLLRGKPIELQQGLILYQPTIGQIEQFGEQKFLNVFYSICSCAWDHPSALADIGIDFMSIDDWSYFYQTVLQFSKEDTSLIFGDLDFSLLQPCMYSKDEIQEVVLANSEEFKINNTVYQPGEYLFTKQMYMDSIPYVREMIGFSHSGRKAANKATAKILIMDDRKQSNRNKNKPYESMFHNGIISLVNTEEFSYTYETVFDLTIYQFMKSLLQIQGKKQACAMLQGSMSGFVDTSKIPSSHFQWTYSEEKYNKRGGKTLKDSLSPGGGSLNVKPSLDNAK